MNPNHVFPGSGCGSLAVVVAVYCLLFGHVAGAEGSPDEARILWQRGRSQYLAGEPEMAARTLSRLLALDPAHAGARSLLQRIAADTAGANPNRTTTVAQMLVEVEDAWRRPVARADGPAAIPPPKISALFARLESVFIPNVSFERADLPRVVKALGALAEEYGSEEPRVTPINFALLDPDGGAPEVNLTLHDVTLRRLLDLVTQAAGYHYEVLEDAVVIRPASGPSALETRIFAVPRAAVLRLAGRGPGPDGAEGRAAASRRAAGSAATVEEEGRAIRSFLQLAGVDFDGTPGSSLAFDGSQVIVTQTPRNLERSGNILARYREVRQVEIEARFMEVQDGALEEIGMNWGLASRPSTRSGALTTSYATSNRSLAEAFSYQGTHDNLTISVPPTTTATGSGTEAGTVTTPGLNLSLPVAPPGIPGGVALGPPGAALATVTGILGEFSVNAVVRALAQKSGTELLSSPKVTVLSGSQATITVAQELRYPQAYGQVQSQVGTGNTMGGGSAGVTITAGTPQDFATRDIGVELRVTPTVEEDDASISLELNPKVTEFEGFVEYGGASVAIASGTTVTVPSGFYQPIFAVRDIATRVTLWDGATLVMGGLTREDVRTTNDKVPVLGNVPVLGRLFRSSGSSAQKRNLLIFVTASLVNPGGAPRRLAAAVPTGRTLFENPTIVTPAGPVGRRRGEH